MGHDAERTGIEHEIDRWKKFFSSARAAPEVEKIAQKADDPVLARWLRERNDPRWWLRRLDTIKRDLGNGDFAVAAQGLRRLWTEGTYIAERVAEARRPLAVVGDKVLRAAQKGHAEVHGTPEEKARRWQELADAYAAEHAAGTAKTAAAAVVAERFGVNEKTVRRAVKRQS